MMSVRKLAPDFSTAAIVAITPSARSSLALAQHRGACPSHDSTAITFVIHSPRFVLGLLESSLGRRPAHPCRSENSLSPTERRIGLGALNARTVLATWR